MSFNYLYSDFDMQIALEFITLSFITINVILGYDNLSLNKKTSQFKTTVSCSTCVATNAVDRNLSTCTRTDFGQTSPDQITWWYVDLGAVHSVHNIRIQFKDYGQEYATRQMGRFAGFSLYVSNTSDIQGGYLCYKDGPELPPLDFNRHCNTHGRYVIFYNERLKGIQYPQGYQYSNVLTELCEVTVTGCSTINVYGCEKPCPDNCHENRCEATNGTCEGCTSGWIGEYCQQACPVGYYGLKCESECVGHCKDIAGCNHTSGLCDSGCDDGWTGTHCTKACPPKSYGPNCIKMCGHCSDDVTCNRTTGKCDTGCESGYTGELCDKGCERGKFGIDCSSHCSGNCIAKDTCNPTNGHCDNGCASGYLEVFCNKTCDKGTYGLDCMQNCSFKCVNGLCNNVDGSCICANGKKGSSDCNDANVQPNLFDNDCNELFYIAGLSVSIIISISLGIACLLFLRKNKRLVKKMRSLQYASITRISLQPVNNDKDNQHYEELRVSENSYHNIELKS